MGTNFYAIDPGDDRATDEGHVHVVGKRSFTHTSYGVGPLWQWDVEPGEMERWTQFVNTYGEPLDRVEMTALIANCWEQMFECIGRDFS